MGALFECIAYVCVCVGGGGREGCVLYSSLHSLSLIAQLAY